MNVTEEMYRRVVEAGPEGIWVVDPQGRTIFTNSRMAQILGVDSESMPQVCFDCVYPEELADAQHHFARTFAGDPRPFDFRLRRGDGSPIWVSISCMPLQDDAGNLIGLLGLFSDITERKQAEAALRESEERFRNMADTAPVTIWVTGPDKQFTFVNKTWIDFTGRTMEQELGEGWTDGLHPDDRRRCLEVFRSAFDARRDFQIECRHRRHDGEYRLTLCSGVPRFAPGGVFAGYIGSCIDITDLQSEERFRQLAENIDQVFWMLDLRTRRVIYVSPAFQKVWGHSPSTLYNNRAWLIETVHPDDRERIRAAMTKLESAAVEETYRIVHPDGSVRWIHDRTFPVYDAGGRPYRVVGIAEDVSAQRELEEQLRESQKMEALGRLAGGIAHDFNNLLTVICGYSKMLVDRLEPGAPARPKLEQILNAGNLASMLTRQLLAFSRRQVREPRIVNLNHLLTSLESLLHPLIGEHIRIETELDPGLCNIKADPHQIEQVVMNLAANARDAMPNGGQFRIETRMALNVGVHVEAGEPTAGSWVRLRISDTGCGMDERTRKRAFEPFFTTKGAGKGTGLGLSTVYGIVRQNQGYIHLSSEPGQGTAFDIYLPPVSEEQAESDPAAKQFPQTRATQTILVVEDQPAVRGLVREALEQLGYTVLDAADGYEALQILQRETREIQLLLTDVIMPLMNGRDLAARMRAIRPKTKVLYMSGYTDEVLAFHGFAHPGTTYLQKPFTNPELAAKVELALAGGKGNAE